MFCKACAKVRLFPEITKLFVRFFVFFIVLSHSAGIGHGILLRRDRIRHNVLRLRRAAVVDFFRHITLVVSDDERRQRQGDNQADEAEQCAPHREREQDDGGIKPHGLAHYLRRQHHVGDGLHDEEHADGRRKDYPEVLPRVGGLKQRQEYHGDEGQSVNVRYEAQNAYQYAEAYRHGEIDYRETYAEKNSYAQRHEALAADVAVHLALHVAYQLAPERAVLLREELDETRGQLLVVKKDEKEVKQRYERGHYAQDDVGRLAYHGEEFRHGAPDGL